MEGSNLGQRDETPRARARGTGCASTVWVSNSTVVCKISRGVGENIPLTVTMLDYLDGNIQRFNVQPPQTFSYDRPQIAGPVPINGPAYPSRNESSMVTILGSDFATVDMTMKATVGLTSCETSQWISSTTLLCRNSPSLEQAQGVAVTLLNMRTRVENIFSYDRSEILRVAPFNARTIGLLDLTVVGSGLGVVDLTHRARLHIAGRDDGLTCLATNWKSDSSVHCHLPAAIDSAVSVAVTFQQYIQTLHRVFSFDNPLIDRVAPTNLQGVGSHPVTLFGENFGKEADLRSANLGDTVCLNLQWTSDSAVVCTAAAGYAQHLQVAITVATAVAEAERDVSYNRPTMTEIWQTNGPATGDIHIRILGQSFGPYQLTPVAFIDSTACPQTEWTSASSLLCKTPSAAYKDFFYGKTSDATIRLGPDSDVLKASFTYDMACTAPCAIAQDCAATLQTQRCNAPTGGDFRHSLNEPRVLYDQYEDPSVLRIIGNFLISTEDVVVGNTTLNQTVSPREQITSSHSDVTVLIGGLFVCEVFASSFDTVQSHVDCLLPPGVGHDLDVQLTIRNNSYFALFEGCTAEMKEWGEQTFLGQPWGNCFQPEEGTDYVLARTPGLAFSYDRPTITHLTPDNGPNRQAGNFTLTVSGTNFAGVAREIYKETCRGSTLPACVQMYSNAILFGNESCPAVDFLVPEGLSAAATADAIDSRQLAFCPDWEQFSLKCQNPFVDNDDMSLCEERCRFAYLNCGRRCPEDRIKCIVLPMGGQPAVTIAIAGVSSPSDVRLHFRPPRIYSVSPPELLAGTSTALTVVGKNFGVAMAVTYLGKVYRTDVLTGLVTGVEREFDPGLVPFNASSLLWWDRAQYKLCFNAGADLSASPYLAECNQGLVYSVDPNDISLSLVTDSVTGEVLEQMVVQTPVVNPENGTVQGVSAIVESFGLRSDLDQTNATLSFRRSCVEFGPELGVETMPFYKAVEETSFAARAYFSAAAHTDDRLFVMAGTTQSEQNSREIFTSAWNGIFGFTETGLDEAVPWFSERINMTAVTFQDMLVVMGGINLDNLVSYNDLWVWAESEAVVTAYATETTPRPALSVGETFRTFWIEVKPAPPWSPRSRLQAVEFRGELWVLGGVTTDGDWPPDLYRSKDLKTWILVTASAAWKGRNTLHALAYDNQLWVVGSVQAQFYNTFVSPDGERWYIPDSACALTNVDVQAAISFRRHMILFVSGCFDYRHPEEIPSTCGDEALLDTRKRENRIFYSKDGRTWTLARRPFALDEFLVPQAYPYEWSGFGPGEFRWGYQVVQQHNTVLVMGGFRHVATRDTNRNYVLNLDGHITYADVLVRDIHVSKGLVPLKEMCAEKEEEGLRSEELQQRLNTPLREQQCGLFYDGLAIVRRRGGEPEPPVDSHSNHDGVGPTRTPAGTQAGTVAPAEGAEPERRPGEN